MNDPQQDEFDEVSSQYRALDQEGSPESLDRAVLRMARQEVRRDSKPGWLDTFAKPLALAAGVAVVAIVAINFDLLTSFDSGANRTPLQAGSDAYPGQSTDSGYCNDEQIATIESWQSCISELEASGRIEDADSERNRLRRAHPDAGALAR